MKFANRILNYKFQYKDISKLVYIVSLHLLFAFSMLFFIINLFNHSNIYSIVDKIIMIVLSFMGLITYKKNKDYLIKVAIILYILAVVLPSTIIINHFFHYYTLVFIMLFSFFVLSLFNNKIAIMICSFCLIEYSLIIILNVKFPIFFSKFVVQKQDVLLFHPIVLSLITLGLLILFYNYHKSIHNVDKLNKQLERDSKLNNMLLNLTYLATKDNDIESILDYILNQIIDIVDYAEKGSIMKNVDGKCEYICVSGYDIDLLNSINMPIDNCHLYKLTDGKMDKTVQINGFNKIDESYKVKLFNSAGFHYNTSTLTSPIYVDGKVWGVVNLDSKENTTFNNSDFKLADILSIEIAKLISFSLLLTDNENLKNKDALTHLYNRRYFTDIVERILASDKKINLTIIAIDLDNLKKINDNYGHVNGDKYIKKFAKALTKFFDDESIISRYGGDEFFIVLKDKTKYQAKSIINRIKSYLDSSPLEISDEKIVVDFSYGIIESENSKKFKDLIALADYEMYSNKHLKKAAEIVLNSSEKDM